MLKLFTDNKINNDILNFAIEKYFFNLEGHYIADLNTGKFKKLDNQLRYFLIQNETERLSLIDIAFRMKLPILT